MAFLKKTPAESQIEPQSPRSTNILDYNKQEDRQKIIPILTKLFNQGITDLDHILKIVYNPSSEPRIMNITREQIRSQYANHVRYQKEKESRVESKKNIEPKEDERVDILERQFIELSDRITAQAKSQENATESLKEFISDELKEPSKIEIVEPKEHPTPEPPQPQPPELPPQLKEEHERMARLNKLLDEKKQELDIKEKQLGMSKKAREIIKKLQIAEKKLDKESVELDDIERIIAGEEIIPEEEPEPKEKKKEVDDLTMDVFKILKELKEINPRTLKNVVNQIEGIKTREIIKKVLYGGGE